MWRRPPGTMVQPEGEEEEEEEEEEGGEEGEGEEEEERERAAVTAAATEEAAEKESGDGWERLLAENRELKRALRRSTECVRARCEELRRLQSLRGAERELLRCRAGQARALVESLRGRTPTPAPDVPVPPCHPLDPDPAAPPSSLEQLRQRLAAAETELAAAREAAAQAEARAEAAAKEAAEKMEALRRELEQEQGSVRAQVTSLLGELHESQGRLESGRRDRDALQHRLACAESRCRTLEEATGQQRLQLDQLRLQTQSLEAALRAERLAGTEEKRKLVQLQVAYHHLFQEYDGHIRGGHGDRGQGQGGWQELQEAREQLRAAEEALAAKQELIDRLKEQREKDRAALESVPVLRAQAEIFRADFAAERAAREQLHAQREALQAALEQLRLRLQSEGSARARLDEMRNRHSDPRPPSAPGFGGPRAPPEEEPELSCPKCQYKAPDMDTLQIHVMECIK